jgi:hypothetical protein
LGNDWAIRYSIHTISPGCGLAWLITSFGLAAGQHLVAALLTLGHHRIGVVLVTLGAATTIVGGLTLARAYRRSASRRRSTS